MPCAVTRTSVQTPLKSSIVTLSLMNGKDASEASGFSRLNVMVTSSMENVRRPSCSVNATPSAMSVPSCMTQWMLSTSPFMFISAAPSAPMVRVISMPMSASG